MALYAYRCPECNTEFDEFKPMAERQFCECPSCGGTAKQRILPCKIDYLAMGVSLSFPTAADKWAKMHEKGARESD